MNYKILVQRNGSSVLAAMELEKEIRRLMQDGWKPQGGVSITSDKMGYSTCYTVCQAMLKENSSKKSYRRI